MKLYKGEVHLGIKHRYEVYKSSDLTHKPPSESIFVVDDSERNYTTVWGRNSGELKLMIRDDHIKSIVEQLFLRYLRLLDNQVKLHQRADTFRRCLGFQASGESRLWIDISRFIYRDLTNNASAAHICANLCQCKASNIDGPAGLLLKKKLAPIGPSLPLCLGSLSSRAQPLFILKHPLLSTD